MTDPFSLRYSDDNKKNTFKGQVILSISVNAVMTVVILLSLKTIEPLKNGVASYFGVTPSFSITVVSLGSLQTLMMTLSVNRP